MELTLEQAKKMMEENGGWLDLSNTKRFAEFFEGEA